MHDYNNGGGGYPDNGGGGGYQEERQGSIHAQNDDMQYPSSDNAKE